MSRGRGPGDSRAPRPSPPREGPAPLSITALARRSGVASSALRYYESIGLLAPESRTRAGYRLYAADAADRVAFIRLAQEAGLTLEDVRAVLEPRASSANCTAVRAILRRRLDEVRAQLERLRRFERVLAAGIACRTGAVDQLCARLCAEAGGECGQDCA